MFGGFYPLDDCIGGRVEAKAFEELVTSALNQTHRYLAWDLVKEAQADG